MTRSVQKRQQDGIDLAVVAQVVYVGVNLIAQTQVQSELWMDSPVVLKISRRMVIVRVRDDQRNLRDAAANGDGEQSVPVIDDSICIAILVREVLDELDRPGLENSEIEVRANALELTAEAQVMFAMNPIDRVVPL